MKKPAIPPITERAFQAQVIQLARMLGYLVYHVFDARRSAAGFPDLAICGHGKAIFAELKTDRGRVSPEQEQWLAALRVAGVDARLWRPSDWPEIQRTLMEGRKDA